MNGPIVLFSFYFFQSCAVVIKIAPFFYIRNHWLRDNFQTCFRSSFSVVSNVINLFGSMFPLLSVQGTLRDLSKGGRNLPVDQIEPVCSMSNSCFSFQNV